MVETIPGGNEPIKKSHTAVTHGTTSIDAVARFTVVPAAIQCVCGTFELTDDDLQLGLLYRVLLLHLLHDLIKPSTSCLNVV